MHRLFVLALALTVLCVAPAAAQSVSADAPSRTSADRGELADAGDPTHGTLQQGDPVRGDRRYHTYVFEVRSNRELHVELLGSAEMEVTTPSGRTTRYDACPERAIISACFRDLEPEGGVWSFRILDQAQTRFERPYSVYVHTPLTGSATQRGELTRDTNLRPLLLNGSTRRARQHTLRLDRGDRIRALMMSDDFDPYLRLQAGFAEINDPIAHDDDSGPGLAAQLEFTAPESGYYTLLAGARMARNDTGIYGLTVLINPGGQSPAPRPTAPRPTAHDPTPQERPLSAFERGLNQVLAAAPSYRSLRGPSRDNPVVETYDARVSVPGVQDARLTCNFGEPGCEVRLVFGKELGEAEAERLRERVIEQLTGARLSVGPYRVLRRSEFGGDRTAVLGSTSPDAPAIRVVHLVLVPPAFTNRPEEHSVTVVIR
ncbi:MAG: hypothetical protein AAGI52_13815 [Bacteroidota bacterium]